MAMNGNSMGDAMKAAIDGTGDKNDRVALFRAMGQAVVAHIIANGLVTVTVASVSGVVAGPGASGPGTGTGTIS